jgi:hypothetical protein
MNAIALLKEQHEEAQRGFRGIEQARREERGTVWAALRPKLKLHEQLEEAHVYGPAAHDSGAQDRLASWPARHQQEVREVAAIQKAQSEARAQESRR